ncbi:MAG: hypothetical protein PWQ25_1653 [Deferribacteres bacterium]|jgi:ABC-type lipoprotein export system ATPase subunit|nr:hypothetical protein [Deferribacteraceae bacterium]MDK2792790.1 hypothetical protein [Deferribacteres bacterium]
MNICWIDNKINDKEIIYDILALKNVRIAVVNKIFPLISNLSVFENIVLPVCYHTGEKLDKYYDKVASLLKQFNMDTKIHFRQNELSKYENFVVRFLQGYLSGFDKIVVINEIYDLTLEEKKSVVSFLKAEKSDNVLFMEYNRYKNIYDGFEYNTIEDYKNWLTQGLKI